MSDLPARDGRPGGDSPLDSRMNRLFLVLLGLQVACDPGVSANYRVSMQPTEADSIIPLSGAIANELAQRHSIGPQTDQRCSLADYFVDFGGTHWLDFCVTRVGNGVEFQLFEFRTTHWGAKGDSLRHELRDTLAIQFGPRFSEAR